MMTYTFDPSDELAIRVAAVEAAALLVAHTQHGENTSAGYLATETIIAAKRIEDHLRRES